MEEFSIRIGLIVLGALGMGGLLLHGLWSIRKQQSGRLKEKPLADVYRERKQQRDNDGFDEHGLGAVRTFSDAADGGVERKEPALSALETETEQPELSLEQPIVTDHPDMVISEVTPDEADAEEPNQAEPQPQREPEQVLMLSVVASSGASFHGADLLPQLLTLGFKFGDMAIFHRHEDSAGTGPVLFSLANMLNPGTFDVDHMESFQTPGVTLFLALPNEGDASQSFNMMLSAAQKLAREMGGQVLDDTRSVLNNQKIRHYQERIREYERQQLLAH